MNLERFLILLLLFGISVLLFEPLETAIAGISVVESLQPILSAVPVLFVGSLFFAMVYLGLGGRD